MFCCDKIDRKRTNKRTNEQTFDASELPFRCVKFSSLSLSEQASDRTNGRASDRANGFAFLLARRSTRLRVRRFGPFARVTLVEIARHRASRAHAHSRTDAQTHTLAARNDPLVGSSLCATQRNSRAPVRRNAAIVHMCARTRRRRLQLQQQRTGAHEHRNVYEPPKRPVAGDAAGRPQLRAPTSAFSRAACNYCARCAQTHTRTRAPHCAANCASEPLRPSEKAHAQPIGATRERADDDESARNGRTAAPAPTLRSAPLCLRRAAAPESARNARPQFAQLRASSASPALGSARAPTATANAAVSVAVVVVVASVAVADTCEPRTALARRNSPTPVAADETHANLKLSERTSDNSLLASLILVGAESLCIVCALITSHKLQHTTTTTTTLMMTTTATTLSASESMSVCWRTQSQRYARARSARILLPRARRACDPLAHSAHAMQT